MQFKVFIDGQEGTTGIKIFERLRHRSDIEVLKIDPAKRKDIAARCELIGKSDLTMLCLPDIASREIVEAADGTPGLSDTKIIDTSTAFRTTSEWVYGMPELDTERREQIRQSTRVAVPGCHATGFILLTKPLIDAGILNSESLVVVNSITGYSGGGKKMIASYGEDHSENRVKAPVMYALTQHHKHLPEMVAATGIENPPVFNPIIGDYYSGMLVSLPLHLQGGDDTTKGYDNTYDSTYYENGGVTVGSDMVATGDPNSVTAIERIYKERYEREALIDVTFDDCTQLVADKLSGRDDMEIFVNGNDRRAVVYARYDNLGKGASGAAMQCMNIMLGLDETIGLKVGE